MVISCGRTKGWGSAESSELCYPLRKCRKDRFRACGTGSKDRLASSAKQAFCDGAVRPIRSRSWRRRAPNFWAWKCPTRDRHRRARTSYQCHRKRGCLLRVGARSVSAGISLSGLAEKAAMAERPQRRGARYRREPPSRFSRVAEQRPARGLGAHWPGGSRAAVAF